VAQATVAPPTIKTMADLQTRLGGIPLDRIWIRPAPGTAIENDVIEAEACENRLCELIDGTLVEKAAGFEESRLAGELMYLVTVLTSCRVSSFPSLTSWITAGARRWDETD
jgi:hypothetical protein